MPTGGAAFAARACPRRCLGSLLAGLQLPFLAVQVLILGFDFAFAPLQRLMLGAGRRCLPVEL